MLEPYFLHTGAGIAVLVAYDPGAVDAFEYGEAILKNPAAEGVLRVEIIDCQGIGRRAIVAHRRCADFGRFWILIAENVFIGANDRWTKCVTHLQIATAKIAGNNMPYPCRDGLPNVVARERVGNLLANIVEKRDFQESGTRIGRIGRQQLGRY